MFNGGKLWNCYTAQNEFPYNFIVNVIDEGNFFIFWWEPFYHIQIQFKIIEINSVLVAVLENVDDLIQSLFFI
jgi:hypothetical protein